MFSQPLGVTPVLSLTVDTLHALYLGCMLVFTRHLVWFLLLSGLYAGLGAAEERLPQASLILAQGFVRLVQRAPSREPSRSPDASR